MDILTKLENSRMRFSIIPFKMEGNNGKSKGSNMVNKKWGWVYLLLTKIRFEKTERQNSSGGNRLNAKNIFQPGN